MQDPKSKKQQLQPQMPQLRFSVVPQGKGFSALSLHLDRTEELDEAVSGKGQGYVLNHKEATCCEGKARSYEIGVSAAAGIAIGTSAVGFEGYNKWSGDGKHCEFKYGQLQEVCGGLALGLGIDMTVANGWWKDADSTKGQSSFAGATLCFGICFGGEYVVDTSFSQIGWVISSGGDWVNKTATFLVQNW